MENDVTDGVQELLFKTGEPQRWPPTEQELAYHITRGARAAVARWHRGRPPKVIGDTFEDLRQQVILEAYPRLKKYRHGGKYPLRNFAYFACCCALRDIQRRVIRLINPDDSFVPQCYPLFDDEI